MKKALKGLYVRLELVYYQVDGVNFKVYSAFPTHTFTHKYVPTFEGGSPRKLPAVMPSSMPDFSRNAPGYPFLKKE